MTWRGFQTTLKRFELTGCLDICLVPAQLLQSTCQDNGWSKRLVFSSLPGARIAQPPETLLR